MRDDGEFIFEKLLVYKRSLAFSIHVTKNVSHFKPSYDRIRGQFVGAAISIPLNIAEGNGRESSKDRVNFFKIARSSSFECIPLIEICCSLSLIDSKTAMYYRNEVREISSMLSGLIKHHKSHQ